MSRKIWNATFRMYCSVSNVIFIYMLSTQKRMIVLMKLDRHQKKSLLIHKFGIRNNKTFRQYRRNFRSKKIIYFDKNNVMNDGIFFVQTNDTKTLILKIKLQITIFINIWQLSIHLISSFKESFQFQE